MLLNFRLRSFRDRHRESKQVGGTSVPTNRIVEYCNLGSRGKEADSRTIRWKEAGDEKAQTVEDEKRNFRSKCCACSLVAQAQDDHL